MGAMVKQGHVAAVLVGVSPHFSWVGPKNGRSVLFNKTKVPRCVSAMNTSMTPRSCSEIVRKT